MAATDAPKVRDVDVESEDATLQVIVAYLLRATGAARTDAFVRPGP